MAKNKTLRGTVADLTKILRTAQQRGHLVFEILKAGLRRAAASGGSTPLPGQARLGGGSGATGGAPTRGSARLRGRRSAASSRCAISARFWSALDSDAPARAAAGGGGTARAGRGAAAAPSVARGSDARPRSAAASSARRARRAGAAASGSLRNSTRRVGAPRHRFRRKPASGSLRRSGRRRRAAHFVGERGPRRPRRRFGHRGSAWSKASAREPSPSLQRDRAAGLSAAAARHCRPGRGAIWSRAGIARTIFGSTTMSVGPPIISRCSTLSRRTSTSLRRPSTAAASITARRGIRPRLVSAPRRLPPNRRTTHAAAPISASTTTKAKINSLLLHPCPRQRDDHEVDAIGPIRSTPKLRDSPNLLTPGHELPARLLITMNRLGKTTSHVPAWPTRLVNGGFVAKMRSERSMARSIHSAARASAFARS